MVEGTVASAGADAVSVEEQRLFTYVRSGREKVVLFCRFDDVSTLNGAAQPASTAMNIEASPELWPHIWDSG